jgi:hypothetical protein
MKISVALFGLVLEAAFIVYCTYMIYLLDILDPFPREWMIPNIVIGAAVLAVGYLIVVRMKRSVNPVGDDQLSERRPLR